MSFGFSVGDFIAVGKLVADIILCLKDSTGSQSEYRDLVRELECLQSALVHLDRLTQTEVSRDVDSIKYAALSCRRPLEDFLARIRKYETSLGTHSNPNPIKAAIGKMKFPLGHSDEIRKLQAYLSVHLGSINILLAEHGLEKMELVAERSEAGYIDIRKRLEDTDGLLRRIRTSIVCQTFAVFKSMTMLEKIYKILSGELKASLQSFEALVTKVCISTQQIYAVVLEVRTSIAQAPDVRWTFLQDPIIVEDALGRKFPVPSEYDFSLLDAIIQHKFQDGPGAVQVAAGHYEIMDAKDKLRVLSIESQLIPGGTLIMAILISMPRTAVLADERCPIPRCRSTQTTAGLGGGRLCCDCNIWFDRSTKQLGSLRDLWNTLGIQLAGDQANKRKRQGRDMTRSLESFFDDISSLSSFKNMKLTDYAVADECSISERVVLLHFYKILLGSMNALPMSKIIEFLKLMEIDDNYPER